MHRISRIPRRAPRPRPWLLPPPRPRSRVTRPMSARTPARPTPRAQQGRRGRGARRQAQDRDRQARRPGRPRSQAEADALDPQIAKAVGAHRRASRPRSQSLRAQIAVKTAQHRRDDRRSTSSSSSCSPTASRRPTGRATGSTSTCCSARRDIGDLITRTELVSRVIQSNNDIAAQLAATKTDARALEGRTRPDAAERQRSRRRKPQAAESKLKQAAGRAAGQGRRSSSRC